MVMASGAAGIEIQKIDAFERDYWFAYVYLLEALLFASSAF